MAIACIRTSRSSTGVGDTEKHLVVVVFVCICTQSAWDSDGNTCSFSELLTFPFSWATSLKIKRLGSF